jgi:hypothetical protein
VAAAKHFLRSFFRRTTAWDRIRFARAGFAARGPHPYLAPPLMSYATTLKRLGR